MYFNTNYQVQKGSKQKFILTYTKIKKYSLFLYKNYLNESNLLNSFS